MTVQIRPRDIDGCSGAVDVTITRGDRVAIPMRTRVPERVAAWTGADWLAQVRRTADSTEVVAAFTATESTETVDGVDVLTVLFVVDGDTSDWSGSYVLDFQLASGPGSPYTYLPGSTIFVAPDASREEGS